MTTATQFDISALLELAGAIPPRHGRGRWMCPECKRPALSVNRDKAVFHCFHAGCSFSGNTRTLQNRLGIHRQWLPQDEYFRRRRELERAREAAEEKEHIRARLAGERAAREWGSLQPAPSNHPYLTRKAIPPMGARLDGDGKLVIPVSGIACGQEVVVSLERIGPDGQKLFEAGSHIRAGYCFLPVGPIPPHPPERVWVAEGFATGATVGQATGEVACCVFHCGNFIPALEGLTQRMPGTIFVLAADNDSSKPGNPGLTAAKAAAQRFGLYAVWPKFPRGVEGSDFNDLALEIGIDGVREELQSVSWS